MKESERLARQSWRRVAVIPPVMGVVLFTSAGRLDWYAAWAFIAMVLLVQVEVVYLLLRKSPDLLIERSRFREGTKRWDKPLVALITTVFPLWQWIAAGLEFRERGASAFSPALQIAGFAIGAAACELTARAMLANRFFANTVRIQTERGHKVVSSGPYGVVRHPGYVGMIVFGLAAPLALGSRNAFLPTAICTVVFIVRTALEDRTLQAELAGYREYAQRVRARLIPGLW